MKKALIIVSVVAFLLLILTGSIAQVLTAEKSELEVQLQALTADKAELLAELADINAVYPPRYFSDYDELRDWVVANPAPGPSWENHLRWQRTALEDGYIWSVALDRETYMYNSCVIAGDSVYWAFGDGTIEWISWR